MSGPAIARLGHVGLYVHDLAKMTEFYRDVLGLTVTDGSPEAGAVFLSARPQEEHHEFLLVQGRRTEEGARWLQQISFRCDAITDVVGFHHRLKARGVTFDRILSHGNAIGVYFFDPEGNRGEVYCPTGLKARQPYIVDIDVTRPIDLLMAEIEESVRRYGETGIVTAPG
jgi:catechol 2,3-dioxygenase-like lactoylglutathione lyase family enzyme